MSITLIERLTADNHLLLKHMEYLFETRGEGRDAPANASISSEGPAMPTSLVERLEVENRLLAEQVEHLRRHRPRGYDADELYDRIVRNLPHNVVVAAGS
jgi:hypothetical protein